MLVEGAWESSAGPPTGLYRLKHAVRRALKTTTYSNPLQEPQRPRTLVQGLFVAGTPNGAPPALRHTTSAPTQGAARYSPRFVTRGVPTLFTVSLHAAAATAVDRAEGKPCASSRPAST